MAEPEAPAATSDAPEPQDALRPTTGQKGALPRHIGPATPGSVAPAAIEAPDGDDDEGDMPGGAAGDELPFVGRAHIADVHYGEEGLPAPVAALRRRLVDAAKTGEIDELRAIFSAQPAAPIVVPPDEDDSPGDPVDALRRQSGDPEGREILAILLEILEAGYVEVRDGSQETYVWPYFAEVPLTELTPKHYVELYRVLTASDVEDMMRDGRYGFFRLGISAEGRLLYFSAGDL